MSTSWQGLQQEYVRSLGSHLAKADEAALNRAYELGRQALSDGLGMLDLVLLHHEVLATFNDRGANAAEERILDRAAEFLAESLAPFEMSLRGYREANLRLSELNDRLQQAKTATEIANRELESFSYSVAHDLRAPLRSIDGFSQALLEDYGDKLDGEGRQHLSYVRQSAQDMAELIDGLLSLSRVTRRELRRVPVDLADFARAVLTHLRKSSPERAAEIRIPDQLPVEGDPGLLRGVIENLIGNAWKFTRNKARTQIELGVIERDGHRIVFVRDNGAGFDMAYVDKLFGVFQRLHSINEYEGTGIGLATVHRIIARHGGRVWADGCVGAGATFYFTLWDPAVGVGGTS